MRSRDITFHDYVLYDLLGDIPGIASRAMFSGWALYKDGVVFGIIAAGELHFKADETIYDELARAGSRAFAYKRGDGKTVTMSYWSVPEEIMEDKDSFRMWTARAVEISQKSKKKKSR